MTFRTVRRRMIVRTYMSYMYIQYIFYIMILVPYSIMTGYDSWKLVRVVVVLLYRKIENTWWSREVVVACLKC